MKIIELTAENVKKLKVVRIRPDSSVVQITGANGSGKSSVLDSIYWALAGSRDVDPMPVREGEDSATITLDLGTITIRRKFAAEGRTTLSIETPDGATFKSPQAMLDKMLDRIAFDPLRFALAPVKEQLVLLRKVVELDVDVDALDAQYQQAFRHRQSKHREMLTLQAQLGEPPGYPQDTVVNLDELQEQIAAANRQNADVRAELAKRQKHQERMGYVRNLCFAKKEELRVLESELAELNHHMARWAPAPELVDILQVSAKMQEQATKNAWIQRALDAMNAWTARSREVDRVQEEHQKADDQCEKLLDQRRGAFARAKMPVDGLTFNTEQLYYRGIPFEQCSSAEQLRISVAIAMAGNPKLRVLRIKDGSLLDDRNMALLQEMADVHDFQVWLERVDTSGQVGIVMEDGEVRSEG